MRVHRFRHPNTLIGALTLTLLLAACGAAPGAGSTDASVAASAVGESSEPAASEAAAPSVEPTPGTALSACELVAPDDIEVALDLDPGTVADGAQEQQSTMTEPAGSECRYEGDWGKLIVNASPTAGASIFKSLAKVYGDSAEALEVGDGGLWFEDNDRGYFLQGSVMVFMQFVFIADGTPFRDPTVALGEALVAKI